MRVVQLHPTLRCNLACRHCYSTSGPANRAGLSTATLTGVLDDAAALGFESVSVSGGEPFLFPDLAVVLRHAKSLGLRTAVTTNGTCFGGGRLAAAAPWLDLVAISCDGPPELHNDVRASPTAFHRLHTGLDQIRQTGVLFGLIHTITRRSWPELGWLGRFAAEEGASLLQLHPVETAGRARGADDLRLDGAELAKAWLTTRALAIEYRERFAVHVDMLTRRALLARPDLSENPGEGIDTLVVEADGVVVPDTYGLAREYAITDLTERSLRAAWPEFTRRRYGRLRELHRHTRESCLAGGAQLVNWFEELVRASSRGAGEVVGGDVAERHRGADGRAGAGVAVAHHGGAGVAGGVQAGDDRAVGAQHPGAGVGAHAALGAEVAGHDLEGVERRQPQRREAGVRAAPPGRCSSGRRRCRRGGSRCPRRSSAKPLNRLTVACRAAAGTPIVAARPSMRRAP